jgi:hypothetical protein
MLFITALSSKIPVRTNKIAGRMSHRQLTWMQTSVCHTDPLSVVGAFGIPIKGGK